MSLLKAGSLSDLEVALPLVTIITVVYNAKSHIEKTLLSVLEQTYPNIEYLVIDGGSTDGTVDIIKRYQKRLTYWNSEKDAGIYDAMNKGLAKAKGQWINFMNAGDTFYCNETLSGLHGFLSRNVTIIYGGVEIIYPDLSRIEWPGCPSKLWQGMQFSHQAALINAHYHQEHPYNTENRIAADLEFMYKAYQSGKAFSRSEVVIAKVIMGGVADSNRIKTILGSCNAICGHKFCAFIRLYYLGRVIDAMLRKLAKFCLPRSMINWLISMK